MLQPAKNTEEKVDILLVDDREDGLIALEAILSEDKRYNLIKARSGREAVSLLPKYDFSMILLDVQMPEWDGFKTAKIISEGQYHGVPIIFVTAINKDDQYIYRGYELGAVDYIFKPFDPVVLKSKVAVFADLHLKKSQIREQARLIRAQESLQYKAQVQAMELENMRRYQDLANAIPHIVWKISRHGEMVYCNQRWAEFIGAESAENFGTGWHESLEKSDLKSLLKKFSSDVAVEKNFEMECRIRDYEGTYHWHWVLAAPERGANQEVVSWLVTCTDIEDRKRTEKKLIDAQKRAEAASEAKTRFLANMSHEIRTPLNAIVGFADLMLDAQLSPGEKLNNFSIIKRNSKHLLRIIDEILDISKIEAGGLEIEKIETNLIQLLAEIQSLMQVDINKKKLKLEFRIRDKIPELIRTDTTRLKQILINIIGNAIKFTPSGGVEVHIAYINTPQKISTIQFHVCDTGIGIDPSSHEKIFTPFSQADSSTTRTYGGTGLGLPLARKLANAMGGNIWLETSTVSKGSHFVIEISAEVLPHTRWAEGDVSGEINEIVTVKPTHSQELSGARILLVEDVPDNQVLIRGILQRSGAIIDIANDGREGMEKALANDYAAVLMDIQMPYMDGYEATTELRKAGYKKPIIAMTAHALSEERDKCLRAGCTDHLTKPIDRKQMVDNLAKHIFHQSAS